MTTLLRCPRCSAPVSERHSFCAVCGRQLSDPLLGVSLDEAEAAYVDDTALLDQLRRATIGHYDVSGKIGRGGMAAVYLAHDIGLDRKVAIKVLLPALRLTPGMAERFKHEARITARLNHPNIIPIYSVGETPSIDYFVMKLVPGRTLDQIVKKFEGEVPLAFVESVAFEVGNALTHAHAHGIYHRDIKPTNIIVDTSGVAVVTDFGIAKRTDLNGMTLTGATLGTPTYMSPEQCRALAVTAASDQYSLGVMLFEMLAGGAPFDAPSSMEVMNKHCSEPLPPLEELRPSCPPAVRHAVGRMLEKRPEDRWRSVDEALEALGAAPLPQDAELRATIVEWASEGADGPLLQFHTPRSPLPASRAPGQLPQPGELGQKWMTPDGFNSGHPPVFPVSETRPVPHWTRRRLIAAGGTALLALGLASGLWLGSRDEGSAAPAERPVVEPPPTPGTVAVVGLPANGVVSLDGQESGEREFDLEPGEYEFRLSAPGFEDDIETIRVAAGATVAVEFDAARLPPPRPTTVAVTLRVEPAAAITVDGAGSGNAERLPIRLEPGVHRLRFTRPGFATLETSVTVREGQGQQTFTFDLVPQDVRLRVRIQPWAFISIDGVDVPGAQTTIDTVLPAGDHFLRFTREGFAAIDTLFVLRPDNARLLIRLLQQDP